MDNEKHVLDRLTEGDKRLSTHDVGKIMGINPTTVTRCHINKKEGELKAQRMGKSYVVMESDLRKYLDTLNK